MVPPLRDNRLSRLTTISAMPNRPMAIGAKSMPSLSSGRSKVKRWAPVLTSVPTRPNSRPRKDHRDRLDDRSAGQHDRGDQAERHQRAIVGRPEFLRHARERLGEQHDDHRADRAGEERAHRRYRQRRAGAAVARHLVAVEACHHRRRFARQVDQDRGRRAAVGGAVIDAGQHDQRCRRRQVEGDRQQHGDRRHRPDAGQDADQRAEHAAQQGVGQVLERDRDAEAQGEIIEKIHPHQTPRRI